MCHILRYDVTIWNIRIMSKIVLDWCNYINSFNFLKWFVSSSLYELTVEKKHTICVWLQICGALCSHGATLLIFWKSWFFWFVELWHHASLWLWSCFRATRPVMWLDGSLFIIHHALWSTFHQLFCTLRCCSYMNLSIRCGGGNLLSFTNVLARFLEHDSVTVNKRGKWKSQLLPITLSQP